MMDQKKVRVAVTAPRGAMDSLILQEAYKNEEIEVVGAVGTPGRDYIGKDAGLVCGLGQEIGAPVVDDIGKIIDDCDIVIDFSRVELSMQILDACLRHGKGLICGTTGFSEEQTETLLAAGDKIPMMKAANTSFVVNVMRKILGIAAEKLGSKAKIEIIEMHSATKRDAPSGTAIELAEEMAEKAPDKELSDIPYHSVRAGNTPSEHRVIFGCMGEKMEISHEAYDWRCYALGACDAAIYMYQKMKTDPSGGIGLYSMDDVIGI